MVGKLNLLRGDQEDWSIFDFATEAECRSNRFNRGVPSVYIEVKQFPNGRWRYRFVEQANEDDR